VIVLTGRLVRRGGGAKPLEGEMGARRSGKRSRAQAWVVVHDMGSLALHDRDTRVGHSWVNTDNSTYMNVNIAGKGDDTYAYQRLLSSCFHRGGDVADEGAQKVRQSVSTSALVSLM
jgi:hypothetical protein